MTTDHGPPAPTRAATTAAFARFDEAVKELS